MTSKHVIAVDLGAESGRVMRIGFDGERLHLEEVHRFPNMAVMVGGTLHWDVLRLWHEITTGIKLAGEAASIGVDTWGVDFGLLDRDGHLLANPVHYRDARTNDMMEWVFERVPRREVFERTGIQFMQLNTLYQIASLVKNQSPVLENAALFLTIPDLLNYWLSGARVSEFTIATTTQFYNPRAQGWDTELLERIGVPTRILPEIVPSGTRLGDYNGIPVIATAGHDTGSAVAAVPTITQNYAYLSSGTWSLLGLELDNPVINEAAYTANMTNEGGVEGKFRFLRNITGMWLVQQSRQTWQEQTGKTFEYAELAALAEAAAPFRSLVDPDDNDFMAPGDMPSRVRKFCERTGQPQPETPGQVTRAIYESLALKYRHALEQQIAVSGQTVERLHIIGGGSRN
ncbi:MAG TPA: rhamnulokinase family protein, partial [Phototrophicaceae bacterium]|nr:rhamnulokinase family protein [Phototrophicaceae bacterium]